MSRTPGSFIDGDWECDAPEWGEARNPATGEMLARLPKGSRETAVRAIAAARAAQPAWAAATAWERAALCRRMADAVEAAQPHLSRVLSVDQGKPLAQAAGEIGKACDGFRMAAELVKYMTGETIPAETPGRLVINTRRPRGVYAVITPWNFPVNIPVEYLAPAIATGNAVVWVPAPSTSLIAVEFMAVLAAAGLPRGLINLVLGEGPVVGDEIVSNPGTDGVGFTGSTATGRRIAERAAGKPLLLELGGNGPLIVRADADLEKAAEAAAAGAFGNAGQICAATGRVLADASIAEPLAELIREKAEAQILGDPLQQGTTMGPLNNSGVLEKTRAHVESAVAQGARCLTGGRQRPDLGSDLFYEPTVLVGVTPQMDVARYETFGPVVPILALDGDAAIMEVAPDGDYGLSMGIFSKDLGEAMAMASRLRAGIININERNNFWELHIPFGGGSGTQSGIGRIGGRHTLEAMTDIVTVTLPVSGY
ncbi:aldehyde dehydrogenase family protein [Pelagibius sp. CAU 1746]|uniref:aldehyde dehydrogenase family protein n=1 Tax=Pelagibius sp. CAU 1746 TaxID=3140370 RepID=UPI00325B30BA